jgi:hypothetical protein
MTILSELQQASYPVYQVTVNLTYQNSGVQEPVQGLQFEVPEFNWATMGPGFDPASATNSLLEAIKTWAEGYAWPAVGSQSWYTDYAFASFSAIEATGATESTEVLVS